MNFTAVPNPGNKPGSIQVTDDGLHKVRGLLWSRRVCPLFCWLACSGCGVESLQVLAVGPLPQVTFIHAGSPHILGLFGSLDESHRVCDVLASAPRLA